MVRILDVREATKPISSPIRNAYIDFSKMTTSLVAVPMWCATAGVSWVTGLTPTVATARAG
jgi:hypothetical protein